MKRALLTLAIILLFVLHQDFWNWNRLDLLLGFIPVGLWYHALYTIAVAGLMWLLVKLAWPANLEREAEQGEGPER
jgi:hypothetical protein